jgi:hypothetical protein
MATVALTTTPTQIDDGTSYTVLVTNTGAVEVDLSRGGRLRPQQSRTVYPEGAALTAAATSGTGTVTTSTTSKPLPNPADSYGPVIGSDAWLKLHAGGNLDALIVGAVTRDTNGAATSAGVIWPDGATGAYTATTVSTAFPGAVDAYTVTYVGSTTKTVTQPAVTRDSTTGAVTTRPAMTVA